MWDEYLGLIEMVEENSKFLSEVEIENKIIFKTIVSRLQIKLFKIFTIIVHIVDS